MGRTRDQEREHRQRQHQRNVARAVAVLDALKLRTGCVDCGFNLWPEALEFDHIDPQTKQAALGWVDDRSRLNSRIKLENLTAKSPTNESSFLAGAERGPEIL